MKALLICLAMFGAFAVDAESPEEETVAVSVYVNGHQPVDSAEVVVTREKRRRRRRRRERLDGKNPGHVAGKRSERMKIIEKRFCAKPDGPF